MSRNYYYFSASLPLLSFGTKPPISDERFLEQAAQFLSPGAASLIANARLIPPEQDGSAESALVEWLRFENSLRNETAKFRAKKLNRDPKDYCRGDYLPDPYLAALVAEAAEEDDPLQVERRIDLARWEKLEEIELLHYFDLHFLIVYFLKLQLLNKWQAIREEKGREVLDELINPSKEPSQ
jgi:hypothetical protein